MAEIILSAELAYQDKVETPEEFGESLFADVYKKAANNLIDIVNASEKILKERENNQNLIYSDFSKYSNNIIAFIGDRGTGKSSALKSFANMLFTNRGPFSEQLETTYFKGIPVIDPSQLKEQEGILESVIANMYTNVKADIEKSQLSSDSKYRNIHNTQEILESFNKTFDSLSQYRKESGKDLIDLNDTPLENLEKLSSGNLLKKNLENIINLYLKPEKTKCQCDCSSKNSYLVIAIDDLDMNIENGFKIAEEIRKFLMMPNVIVVMALNINQFSQLVRREYLSKYEKMIKNEMMPTDDITKIAEKYVTKFLPVNRGNNMPDLTVTGISAYTVIDKAQNDKTEGINLVDYFLSEIYKKTGLLLLKNKAGSHEIIPSNLREIQQLYALLKNMQDVDLYACLDSTDNSSVKKLSNNLGVFMQFLKQSYFCKLPSREFTVVDQFENIDSNHINKFIIQSINQQIKPLDEELFSAKLMPENNSIGNVLAALNLLCAYKVDTIALKFTEGLKMLYSMRFIKLLFISQNRQETRTIVGELLYDSNYISGLASNKHNIYDDVDFYADYYMQFFVAHYNNPDKLKKKELYDPMYVNQFTKGATASVSIDLSACISNLIYPDIMKERVLKPKFVEAKEKNIAEWSKKNITVLPIWSIDFIDIFFKIITRKINLATKDENSFTNKFKGFFNATDEILAENSFTKDLVYNGKALKESFEQLLYPIYCSQDSQQDYFRNNEIYHSLALYWDKISIPEGSKQDNEKSEQDDFDDNYKLLDWSLSSFTNTKPQYIKIGSNDKFYVNSWAQTCIKLAEILINENKNFVEITYTNLINEVSIRLCKTESPQKINVSNENLPNGLYLDGHNNANQLGNICKKLIKFMKYKESDILIWIKR